MHVLSVDTSTHVGSVALVSEGQLRAEISTFVRAKHGELLLPHVERVLDLAGVEFAELSLLAVGTGPGSFTGTRIGLATVKGLALAGSIPVVGVGSLRVLARGLGVADALAVPLVDAHKGELYCGAYRIRGGAIEGELLSPFHASPLDAVREARRVLGDEETFVVCGDGLRKYGELLRAELGAFIAAPAVLDVPRASLLALEATAQFERDGASDLATLEPTYVRPSDAKLPNRSLRVE